MESQAAGRGGRADRLGHAEGPVRGPAQPPGGRGAAADGKGPFLFRPNRIAADGVPQTLFGAKVVRSSQVSGSRTKGTGTALTYAVCGYFPDWVTARMGVMEFLASRATGTRPWPTT